MTSDVSKSPSLDPIAGIHEILDKAAMTGTNKLALLLVLIDLATERTQRDAPISIEELTDRYIALHWNFNQPFRGIQLRHSRVHKKRNDGSYANDSTAMTQVYQFRDLLESNGFNHLTNFPLDSIVRAAKSFPWLNSALSDLQMAVRKDLWRSPVFRLQNLPSTVEPFLFTIHKDEIKFFPGVAAALSSSSEELRSTIQAKIASSVVQYNRDILGEIDESSIHRHLFGNASDIAESNEPRFSEIYSWIRDLSDEPIEFDIFDTRAQNIFRQQDYSSWGDLGALTDSTLSRIRSVGTLTVTRIKEALSQYGSYTNDRLAKDVAFHENEIGTDQGLSDASAQIVIEWIKALGDECTLNSLMAICGSNLDAPPEVVIAFERLLTVPLSVLTGCNIAPLTETIDDLLAMTADAEMLVLRELSIAKPTLEELGIIRGLTRERIRQIVDSDKKMIHDALASEQYRTVRWAVEHLTAHLGLAIPTRHQAVDRWRSRIGELRFQLLRWAAGYVYRDDWLVKGKNAMAEIGDALENAIGDAWLVETQHLVGQLKGSVHPDVAPMVLLDSGTWRDIGEGWLVRWDGAIQDKAERVLRLAGRPMTPAELIAAIGHGTVGSLKNQRGSTLIRVDKEFKLALKEWGLEEYEGITTEIDQRIERGGGVASVSAILAEFTQDFGVSATSVNMYLDSGPYIVSGDEVRHLVNRGYTPSSVLGRPYAVKIGTYWGQRIMVSADNLRGYSFGLDRDIAAHNGLQPEDSLRVPAIFAGSKIGEASLIWRLTNLQGTVDVGRLSSALKELRVEAGDEIILVPTLESCTIMLSAQLERPRLSTLTDDVRRSLLRRE